MIWAFFLGLEVVVVLAVFHSPFHSAQSATASSLKGLAPSLLAAGTRRLFSLPAARRANWIFRMAALSPPAVRLSEVRRALSATSAFPVWLLGCGVMLAHGISWPGVGALAVLAPVGATAVELCMWNLSKRPFACSYTAGRANLHPPISSMVLLIAPLADYAAGTESRLLRTAGTRVVLLGVLLNAARLLRRKADRRLARQEAFRSEDDGGEELIRLEL